MGLSVVSAANESYVGLCVCGCVTMMMVAHTEYRPTTPPLCLLIWLLLVWLLMTSNVLRLSTFLPILQMLFQCRHVIDLLYFFGLVFIFCLCCFGKLFVAMTTMWFAVSDGFM